MKVLTYCIQNVSKILIPCASHSRCVSNQHHNCAHNNIYLVILHVTKTLFLRALLSYHSHSNESPFVNFSPFHSFLRRLNCTTLQNHSSFYSSFLCNSIILFFHIQLTSNYEIEILCKEFNLIKSRELQLSRVILSHRWLFENANMSFC